MSKFCDICGSVVEDDNVERCPVCFANRWSKNEVESELKQISTDKEFLEAMIELKKNDPIEYQLKMSQFKTNLKQQEQAQVSKREEENTIHCPYCNSTNVKKITTPSKAVHTAIFGIFSMGRNSKQWHCNSCRSDF